MAKQNKPAIRFKGFTDAWEQRKLGALCVEFKSGDFISASDIAENEAYPVYGGNGLRGFTNHYNHDGEYALIGRQGALCGNVNYAVGKSYFTEHAVAVRANKTNQTRFLYYLFSTMNLGQYSGQSAQPGLAVGNLVELENVVPSKPEQEKIASFLSSLDHLITLHQRKYDKLQVLKKAMLEKMFPKNGSSVPEIRFKGFTDAWEQRKLGDCFTERCESMPDGELISVTINDGIKKFSELGRHDNSNDDKSKYKKVCAGDIAYNSMRMWQGASGCSPYEGIVSPAYTVLTPNSGINSKCMAYQFKLPATIHTFKINSQGITSDNWNLKFPALSEIEIYVSPYEQEQAKIAAYFANLDHLITLHQRKYDKLQVLKKAMLEKMFPKNGSSVPEIRFKGFTDAWEQRKLGEVVKEVTRNDPTSEAPIMMITANNGFIEQSERYAFDNAGESLKKYILLQKGELAYNHGASKLRPFGSCFALTTAESARIPFVYHCFSAENQNAEFLSIELNGSEVESQLRKIVSSGARMDGLLNISFDEYSTVTVLLPDIKEQEHIADFFRNLDHLITLHQRELEKLQNIKKSMLEKMFV